MGIYFSCRDALVTEHLLDHTQIGSVLHKMGRKGMPEGVRRDFLTHICKQGLGLDHLDLEVCC